MVRREARRRVENERYEKKTDCQKNVRSRK